MDLASAAALGGVLAWGSGLRLYAVVFAAGMLSRFGYLHLPDGLSVLSHPWVLWTAGILLVIEFLADKVPTIDSLWDAVHTFIRIPAGAVLAALAMGEHDPVVMAIAGLLGGTLAAGTHAAKAGSRALINTSPEPFSNLAASLGEDAMVASGIYAAVAYPWLFLGGLAVFVVMLALLLPKLLGGLRLVFGRLLGRAATDRLP